MAVAEPRAVPARPQPGMPYTRDFKDTSITVWWLKDKVPVDVEHVDLEVREFPKPEWRRIGVAAGASEHVVSGLFPNATFEFRLVYRFRGGEEVIGPATAADTLAAGCVPKDGDTSGKKSGCAVQ